MSVTDPGSAAGADSRTSWVPIARRTSGNVAREGRVVNRNPRPSLFIDMPPDEPAPATGDYVVTIGKRGPGTAYMITDSRTMRRRVQSERVRYQLRTIRVEVDEVRQTPEARCIMLRWYPRGKR